MNWSESHSELLYDRRFTANEFFLATSPLRLTTSNFIFQLNTYDYSPYVTSSLTTGWVCRLQLLLVGRNVFTEPLFRNGLHNPVVLLLCACMLRALPSNGRCLQSHRLATCLYATIYKLILDLCKP
jgi:hypothetical protein